MQVIVQRRHSAAEGLSMMAFGVKHLLFKHA
jgi:hypothetical protein